MGKGSFPDLAESSSPVISSPASAFRSDVGGEAGGGFGGGIGSPFQSASNCSSSSVSCSNR